MNSNISSKTDLGTSSPTLTLLRGSKQGAAAPGNPASAFQTKRTSEFLDIKLIRTDGDTRARIDINPAVACRYADLLRMDVRLLPVTVFFDGEFYWLSDGFYRVDAAKQVGQTSILASIESGTRREAQLHAMCANSKHGSPPTSRDKKNAALTLLGDEEWSTWSNYQIAAHSGCTEGSIRNYIKQLQKEGTAKNAQMKKYIKDGKVCTMNTAGLKRKPEPVLEPQVFAALSGLPIADDCAQISALLKLPVEDQLRVVSIIECWQSDGKTLSFSEAARELRDQKVAEEREQRVQDALEKGYDDHFVCGDCVQVLEETTQLQPASVRLLLADGPYGVNYSSQNKSIKTIGNDKTLKEALKIHEDMLKSIEPYMMDDCHIMLFCDKRYEPEFRQIAFQAGYQFKDSLIWYKGDGGRPVENQALRNHERIIWFTKGSPRVLTNITDVLDHPRVRCSEDAPDTSHPTPKTFELLSELIEATTVEGELLIDPFAGSASTLVAAKKLGRKYFGVEKEIPWHAEGTARLKRLDNPPAADTLQAPLSIVA
jgi:DNA modification methylase